MPRFPTLRSWQRLGRTLCVLASLCAYLTAAFGFPVFTPRAAPKGEAPLPTQTRPCGCPVGPSTESGCCCSPGGGGCCGGEPAADLEPLEFRWVIGESALKCRGMATSWVSAGAVLLPTPIDWRPAEESGEPVHFLDPVSVSVTSEPTSPPPRAFF